MMSCAVIAINTLRENLRDRILYNLFVFSVFLMGFSLVLADLTIDEHVKLITDMGLAAINLVGVMIAIFVGIGLVSKEIDRRTVYTIMARPISRAQFILGKYLGLALTLLLNIGIMGVVFLAIVAGYGAPVHLSLVQAIELIFIELLVLTAVALFFSTFVSSAALSAILSVGVYVVGHLTMDLKGLAQKSHSEAVKLVVNAVYYLCPNLEMLNVKGLAATGATIPFSYQGLATMYGLLYAAALIIGACAIFQRRDF